MTNLALVTTNLDQRLRLMHFRTCVCAHQLSPLQEAKHAKSRRNSKHNILLQHFALTEQSLFSLHSLLYILFFSRTQDWPTVIHRRFLLQNSGACSYYITFQSLGGEGGQLGRFTSLTEPEYTHR